MPSNHLTDMLAKRDDGDGHTRPAIALYNPKAALSAIGMIVYAILAISLWYRYYKLTRPRTKWMRWLPVGATMMSVGLGIRIARRNGTGAWSFLGETILLLSAPCAIIAQNYKLLGQLSFYLEADDCLLIRRSFLMPLFLTSDTITFLSQLAGTAMQATTIADIMEYGTYVTLGGLIIQAITLASFISSWFLFRRRILTRSRHDQKWTSDSTYVVGFTRSTDFRWVWWCIGFSCLCCLIRAIYRVVEYASGFDSYVANHEVFFYLFDSIPLALSVGVYIYFWPPYALNEFGSVLPHTQTGGSGSTTVEMSHGKERTRVIIRGDPFGDQGIHHQQYGVQQHYNRQHDNQLYGHQQYNNQQYSTQTPQHGRPY